MIDTNNLHRHKKTLHHLNRIQGQLNVLKRYIEEDRPCKEIAHITASITNSFQSLKIRTLEGYIQHELCSNNLSSQKKKELQEILKLHKK
ncbi:MAG: metal-sensing transcriptional repressor [Candidatus Paceibacterota bacterium]